MVVLGTLFLFSCTKKDSKINILVPAPFSGDAASYGKVMKEGIEIALSELEGDPVKQKINVIYQDSKLSTKEIVNILQQELALHPISVVMPVSTGEAMALAPICNKNQVVLLPPLADGDQLSEARPYFFRISPASSFQGRVLADKMRENGILKAAVLYLNDAWGKGLSLKFKEYFMEKNGNIVAMESCNPGQMDLRTQLQKIKAVQPEALLIILHPTETIPALKQIRELGIKARLYGGDTFSNKTVYAEAAELAQGVIFALPAQPENVIFNKFSAAYKARYRADADINAAAARDAIMIVVEAVRKGATTGDAIKVSLDGMTNGLNGATGLIKWDKNGNVISKKYQLYIVKGDSYEPLSK
jgi:branched-chain amino acid transport system substrate-binding protein